MPAPQKKILAQLIKANFRAKGIQLPMQWKQPGDQFPLAFKETEKMVAANHSMNLFREPTRNKYHVDTARIIGRLFEEYCEDISGAICKGIERWMRMVIIAGVTINGPTGIVRPRCVIGPPLAPLIFAAAPKRTPQEKKYAYAIAQAIGIQWRQWHLGLTGTLSYPLFAA